MKNLRTKVNRKVSTISLIVAFMLIFSINVQAKTKKVKYGTVSGNITWDYNKYITKGDTGAKVYLISTKLKVKNFKKVDGFLFGLGIVQNYIKGKVFVGEANGNGDYKINHIPIGKYKVIIVSNKTHRELNEDITKLYEYEILDSYLNSKQLKSFITGSSINMNQSTFDDISVYKNEDTDESYDFGYTYW